MEHTVDDPCFGILNGIDGDELVPQLQTHSDLINARWPDGGITDEFRGKYLSALSREESPAEGLRGCFARFQSASILLL